MFKQCQKKYHWRYMEQLKPIKKPEALQLGSTLHSAFDSYYKGASDAQVTKDIIAHMDNQIAEAQLPDQENLIVQKYTLLGMWQNFPYKDLSQFSRIESEKEMRIPIADDVEIVCKIDRLVEVKKTKVCWIGELKSTGLPFQQFQNRIATSSQASTYVWMARKFGLDVSGLMFDFIKKPLLRKGSNETCVDYGIRIANDYKQRQDSYYGRHYEYRSDEHIKLFEEDLYMVVSDMVRARRDKCFYRNPDACWFYNSECPYKKICFSKEKDPLTLELYYQQIKKEEGNGREQD